MISTTVSNCIEDILAILVDHQVQVLALGEQQQLQQYVREAG